MSEEERDTLNELFQLRREVKDLRAQLAAQQAATPETPAADDDTMPGSDDPDYIEARGDALYEQGGAMQEEATRLYQEAHARRAEQERPDKLRTAAATLIDMAAELHRRADALAGEAPTPEAPEPRPADSHVARKAQQDVKLRKQAWALYGQLALLGLIEPPNWDEIAVGAIVKKAYDLDGTLNDLEFALMRINQEPVTEYEG